MRTHRRDVEGISLSFLDVISVGFGAVILLLVLTKVFEPVIIEETVRDLEGYLAELQEQLIEIRGQTRDLNREMVHKEDQKTEKIQRLNRMQANLQALRNKYENISDKTKINNEIEGRLARARQSLTEEMERLLARQRENVANNKIGGIPVDSEYVIFIIDTSGSMFNYAWPFMLQKVEETLRIYPQLKGIQVMNDMGNYMFSQYAGQWIPDTPARRRAVISRLSSWAPFSNSSPVEGIQQAISRFAAPDKKISVFVFGDDFSAGSVQRVIDTVNQIVARQSDALNNVRIHAIGFPVLFDMRNGLNPNSIRFAALMRALTGENRGSFVGLNSRFLQQ